MSHCLFWWHVRQQSEAKKKQKQKKREEVCESLEGDRLLAANLVACPLSNSQVSLFGRFQVDGRQQLWSNKWSKHQRGEKKNLFNLLGYREAIQRT